MLSLFSVPALAQEIKDREAIVVTANRLATPLDASTAAVSTLDAADLERRQTTFLVDALTTLPGVTVSQNGAFGGQASVRLRGAASEQTLVLVDGVVVNDPTSPGGGFNAAFLDTNDIARVEVLRGPQSTLWGSDAIGGVINIVTQRPRDGVTGRVNAEAGSFGALRAGGSFGYGGERVDVRLGAAAVGTDGISKADEADGNPEEDDYENVTLDGRLGFDVTRNLRIEAFGRYGDSETAFDSFGSATGVRDGDEISRTEEANGGLVARLNLFDNRFENLLMVSRAEIERRNFTNGVPSFSADGARESFRYQGTFRPSNMATFAFGAEREDNKFEQLGDTSIDGLFVLAEVEPVGGLTLTGGLRRDDHSTFGDTTTGRVGARWQVVDGFGVRGSWGQGFKAPTVFQVSGGGFVPANPNLQPEEAEGWDAAVFFALLNDRFSAEIGVFDLETTNLISFSSAGYVNVARAESNGVEAVARFAATDALTLNANYTFTDATNAVTGRRLTRIPEHTAFLEADWQATPALGLAATVRYNGEETDSVRPRNPTGTVAAWTRLDLAGRYRLSERLELYGRIENVLDEHYQDIFGYGTPGLSAYGGVRVRFE
jgi:vitamin B12 transporter